jgi:hypothetical protein
MLAQTLRARSLQALKKLASMKPGLTLERRQS